MNDLHDAELLAPRASTHHASALVQDAVQVVVPVNGKLRGHISVSPDAADADVRAAALADAQVRRFFEGREPKKVIVVKGRLVNVVV